MTARVFFYVQHLLGTGHARRAAALTQAFVQAGLEVTVAQGGHDVTGADFSGARTVLLPPARAEDASFKTILDGAGAPISDEWKDARRAALWSAFEAAHADVLLIEMYPFGRRMFAFELEPLLERAHGQSPRPVIVCSLRDVLVQKPAKRDKETAETARRRFDKVLVHGDPDFIRLEETFSETAGLADLIEYTGFVAESAAAAEGPRTEEVIISAGGGVAAENLFRAALGALPATQAAGWKWRFMCGPNMAAETVEALRQGAPANAVFEPNRDDFRALLARTGLSISQAGYNTVMDIMASRVPAAVIPFADEGESEQSLRARRLHKCGLAVTAEDGGLAHAIDRALSAAPAPMQFNMNGAARSAQIIAELCTRRRG